MSGRVLVLREGVFGCEQVEELSPGTVLQQEVELLFVLEAHAQLHQEGVLDGSQDLLLSHYVLLLVLLHDVFLL